MILIRWLACPFLCRRKLAPALAPAPAYHYQIGARRRRRRCRFSHCSAALLFCYSAAALQVGRKERSKKKQRAVLKHTACLYSVATLVFSDFQL